LAESVTTKSKINKTAKSRPRDVTHHQAGRLRKRILALTAIVLKAKAFTLGGRVNSRGVTEVILALSLISISVTASVFMYHISAGFTGRANASEAQRINDHLIIEAYNFLVSNTLTISLRNIGNLNVSMTGAAFFLNDRPLTPDDGCKLTLTTGMSCTTALSVSAASLQQGASYPLKIVSSDGGVFSYPVAYGSTG
jgi:hypothetical protein